MSTRSTLPTPDAVEEFRLRGIVTPLLAIVLGAFMAILDTTVVNVALPTFGRVFQADLRQLQWIITGYMLAHAAVIPLSGWLSDRFGAKRVYLAALAVFTAGSLLCATVTSASMLVAFRVLQGLGGGLLMPVGMAFVYRLAPPDRRGAVMGTLGIPMLLGPALGPVLSGWLLEYTDWRFIFLINLPVGIVALAMGLRALPRVERQSELGSLDLPGVVLGPLAFASLSYGISETTHAGWTGVSTLAGLAVGLAALATFVVHEARTPHPLLELRVFRSRDFALGILTQWIAIAGLFGTIFLVPLFLQQVRGYGSFQTGLFTFPQALVSAITMPVAGRIFDRVGPRPPVMGGLALVACAMGLLSGVSTATTGQDLLPALALWGAGMGLLMMPLNTHLLNSAPRDLVSRVTALTGSFQSVVSSLAIASFATFLQGRTAAHLAEAGVAGRPPLEALQGAQAAAFGDAYRAALVLIGLALLMATTLRRERGRRDTGSESPAVAGRPVAMGVSTPPREPPVVA